MRRGIRVVGLEIRRMLCSPWLWLAVVSEALWMFISTFIATSNGSIQSVIYGFIFAVDQNSGYIVLICILPILPYALSFVKEWNDRATHFWIIRTGTRPYMTAKLIAAAMAGFLTVFLGILLYAGMQRFFLPWGEPGDYGGTYGGMQSVALYLLLFVSHKGASGMLVAVCALWVSCYFSNTYVALIGPNAIYWFLLRIQTLLPVPDLMSVTYWIQGTGVGWYPWTVVYGTHWLIILTLCVIMGSNAVGRLREKVEHD